MPIGMVRAPVRLAPFGLRPAAPKAHIGERVFATNTFPATKLAYRVELYLGGSWVDVTAYVYVRNAIRITRGRPDGAIQSQPATCSLTVDNRDGRWCSTNPNGAWYGQLRRGTKLRVCVDHGAGLFERFTGPISELPPRWDVSENDKYVPLQASGVARRLGRGKTLRSAMFRALPSTNPLVYWPCEDGAQSTQIASGLTAGLPLSVRGTVQFAAVTGPNGSAPLVDTSTGAGLYGSVPASAATSWRLEFVAKSKRLTTGQFSVLLQWQTAGGISVWELDSGATVDGGGYLQYITSTGTSALVTGLGNVADDQWRHYRIDASASGGSTAVTVRVNNVQTISTTIAETFGAINSVWVNPTLAAAESVGAVGHIAAWAPWSSSADTYTAYLGNAGEMAHVRFARLCAEEGVDASTAATTSKAMGPQSTAALLALLNECEEADAGAQFDGRSGSRIFQSLDERYNLPVALALDHDLGHVAPDFQPTDDDQRIVNYFTASRTSGSWSRVEDSTSRMGTDPAIGVGRYDDGRTYNVAADGQLPDRAGWQVHLGTVEGLRFPKLSLNFARNPSLIDAWLGCDVGSRVTLAHPPVGMPPDLIDVIVEGYTETIGPWLWTVDLNCSPYQPYRVGVLAADLGDADPFLGHLDWDSCVLSSALTTTQTTALVATVPLMTTTADDYPFDLLVEGERMTATGVYAYLNANPYFETTASPWTAFGGTVARSTAQFHEGAASLLLTPNGIEGFPDARSENVAGITAGTAYQAQAWVRCVSSRNVTVNILWRDAGGAHFSTSSAAVAVTAATWTLLTVSATAPALTAQAQVTVSMAATPPATDLLYIDEAMLINPLLQTLTVTRSVNTVVKTHPAGAVVEMHPESALWLGL